MSEWLSLLHQLDLLWPWWLALLPLPWLVRQLLPPAPEEPPLLAPTLFDTAKQSVGGNQLMRKVAKHAIPLWAWLLWALVVLAAMRPVWYLTPTPLIQQGKDIMLAVDLSGSMEKPDMRLHGQAADRLSVVKEVVQDFIQSRENDRLGLVVFGSRAFVISPLTYDLNSVKTQLQEAQIGMAGDNTAIGDAIGLTIKHLQQAGKQKGVLILLTDGANTDGVVQPLEAAAQAKRFGLKIYTIAIGRSGGRGGGYDYDEATLKRIAEITGGQFYLARNPQQLAEIYEAINRLEQTPYAVHSYRAHTELFVWPLGAVLLISLTLALRRRK
ncbi:MAG TPA: VWA domain-containing protein [Piscirickettsiaceae bacterium]|nr:VWA domain-containing protein [Piscirickettsiaceae bacterium]